MAADTVVEILESTIVDDDRLHTEDQATDCSSSFESTHSELGYTTSDIGEENPEVQYFSRDGSGATTLNKTVDLPRRKNRPLRPEWKTFREGIEWRCRWLDLQVKELQKQAASYDHILNNISLRKKQMFEHENHLQNLAARTLPIVSGWKNKVYHRKRRRKVEDSTEMLSYMSKHPVFSRYGKKQRQEEEVFIQDEPDPDDFEMLHLDLANLSWQEKLQIEGERKGGEDSMEQLLWDIESLQMHAMKLKNQLCRVASTLRKSAAGPGKDYRSPRNSTPVSIFGSPANLSTAKQLQSPTSHPGNRLSSVLKQQPTSAVCRRRISDYDIDNVVMPRNVMATYVEPIKHTFIETPSWRLVTDLATSDRSPEISSSEEETNEETYNRRHAQMEVTERLTRYGPSNRVKYAKGTARGEMLRSSKPHGKGRQPLLLGNQHSYFGFIPKGKRRKNRDRTPFRVSRFEHLIAFQNSVQSYSRNLDTIMEEVDIDPIEAAQEATLKPKTLESDKIEN